MKIFISYRRDDSAATADYLYQALQKLYTPRGVFRDVASIPFGSDFATQLRDTLSQCDVILVLIGRGWLDARDEQGNRRLDQPNDPVREEVALALSSDALVIPVLLDDMPMPAATALPGDLAPLVRRQAATLHSDERRAHDAGVIVAMARAFVRRYPR
ncbi:MAG TPA: toll/interleukin-1 receptor domain-containing protein, partial [Ktedonobacterales bacterium]|nr:toll/interleukin-1 receptor domain-containing protein [Ktedonobacterales bacterium]